VQVRDGHPDVIDAVVNVRKLGNCRRLPATAERGPLVEGNLGVVDGGSS
jgi:hypothetical protein